MSIIIYTCPKCGEDLIKEVIYTYPSIYVIPMACQTCSNHPSNGGSGICHCTLGTPQIIC